jgi:hypothetical protein|tara:strand:+ start:485 stop:697 length:213 start_codon:yes stop_codon:yes gene_type:complete
MSNKKTFKLTNQQIVDALAQYLYDTGEITNSETTGNLVYELSEDKGATVIITINEDENVELVKIKDNNKE